MNCMKDLFTEAIILFRSYWNCSLLCHGLRTYLTNISPIQYNHNILDEKQAGAELSQAQLKLKLKWVLLDLLHEIDEQKYSKAENTVAVEIRTIFKRYFDTIFNTIQYIIHFIIFFYNQILDARLRLRWDLSIIQYDVQLPLLFALDSHKIWVQKNENGAQKNVHIFKSKAPTLLKLGVGFDHMYTKAWIFLDPSP